ncbi:zinc finger protein 385C-like isoform X8 [Rhinatrema bivittatum]|uniref:zinc finger protein 385C-like isoform X8 n=1 Tax=Rhinatrema bivittatum TaxID=194408 RepID=UPI0011291321|nr:zinc finger protein 385C-like isoform X8 [Rhinatrema bivittatum]
MRPAKTAGMKRPLSPSHPPGNGIASPDFGNTYSDWQLALEDQSVKKDKKPHSFTLCEVCNIQLNSLAQTQIHYNGKSHQKRLKQLHHGKVPSRPGAIGPSSSLPASLRIPGRSPQAHLDIKHLLAFRLGGNSTLSLFPNFSTMDPVQKAVINHTFGVPLPLRKKPFISCNICHLRFNSSNQAEAHYKGHKHGRKLKVLEALKERQKTAAASQNKAADLPSLLAATASGFPDSTGAKHKSTLRGHNAQAKRGRGKFLSRTGHRSKRIGNKGSINVQSKAFHCSMCGVYVNSETQLKQHMNSRRHKDRLAGKPPKPKYSLCPKLPKTAGFAAELALQKQFTRTLAARFLPSPLPTATICTLPSPLTLRPGTATALFQAPLLGPAWFRTAPAPLRATSAPIVFAPY